MGQTVYKETGDFEVEATAALLRYLINCTGGGRDLECL